MLRYTLIASALAGGLAFAGPTAARAAPHGGAAHFHGGSVGHVHGGSFGHHHSGFALSVGVGFGFGGYGYGGYGYGGYGVPLYYPAYSPAYYSYPAYYSSPVYPVGYSSPVITTPSDVVVPDPPVVAGGTAVAPPAGPADVAARPNAVQMEVRVPEADAEVWVDGRPTKARGRTRVLVSPELVPGKAYVYKLSAAWTDNGKRVADERIVDVTAGKTVVVDFTAAADKDELPFPKERPADKPPLPGK